MNMENDTRYNRFLENIREASSSMTGNPEQTETEVIRKIRMSAGEVSGRMHGNNATRILLSLTASAAAILAIALILDISTPGIQGTVPERYAETGSSALESKDSRPNGIRLYSAYKSSKALKDRIIQKFHEDGRDIDLNDSKNI